MTRPDNHSESVPSDYGDNRKTTPLLPGTLPLGKAAGSLQSAAAVRNAGALTRASWIAVAFCALVSAAMIYQHEIAAQQDPWKSPQLLALKSKLLASPADENLKTEIRRLDLEFRQRYFRRLALNVTGAWLLVGGVGVLLIATRSARHITQRQPLPQRRVDAFSLAVQTASRARWSVTGLAALGVAGLLALAFTSQSRLPESAAELSKLAHAGEVDSKPPSLAEFQANWPRFRGAEGNGAAKGDWNLGLNGKSGGVLWKSPVPAPGFNSPVVWSNRIFLSGGDAKRREVFCYDATDGRLLWQRAVEKVPGGSATAPEIPDSTGYAASTMATDGRRAFVFFANGDLAAFGFDGSLAWAKNLGVPKNVFGHAASLAIWPGKLILQLDQGEAEQRLSKLLALDPASGRQLWERNRPVGSSWATPIVVEAAGKTQIITLGSPSVIGYAAADGRELWRAELLAGEVTPSPVFAGGLVIAINPSSQLLALRPDGSGEVTKSQVAWTTDENLPDIASPTGNGELIFTATSMGLVTCFDAKNGRKVWETDLATEVQSSPALAGNQVLVLSTQGDVVLLAAAREAKESGRAKLEDAFFASPAFANERIYLRGNTNLWCLGEKR